MVQDNLNRIQSRLWQRDLQAVIELDECAREVGIPCSRQGDACYYLSRPNIQLSS